MKIDIKRRYERINKLLYAGYSLPKEQHLTLLSILNYMNCVALSVANDLVVEYGMIDSMYNYCNGYIEGIIEYLEELLAYNDSRFRDVFFGAFSPFETQNYDDMGYLINIYLMLKAFKENCGNLKSFTVIVEDIQNNLYVFDRHNLVPKERFDKLLEFAGFYFRDVAAREYLKALLSNLFVRYNYLYLAHEARTIYADWQQINITQSNLKLSLIS